MKIKKIIFVLATGVLFSMCTTYTLKHQYFVRASKINVIPCPLKVEMGTGQFFITHHNYYIYNCRSCCSSISTYLFYKEETQII